MLAVSIISLYTVRVIQYNHRYIDYIYFSYLHPFVFTAAFRFYFVLVCCYTIYYFCIASVITVKNVINAYRYLVLTRNFVLTALWP